MGIELSFPIPEGITVATISVCVELVSMTSTAVYGLAIKQYGDLKSNIFVLVFLIVSTVATCLVPPNFKREEIERAEVRDTFWEHYPFLHCEPTISSISYRRFQTAVQ
jgi:hypothetical protein